MWKKSRAWVISSMSFLVSVASVYFMGMFYLDGWV
jgi:hypothetical protein